MPHVFYQGKQYEISDEADEALANYGDSVLAGEMESETAIAHILRCDGLIPVTEEQLTPLARSTYEAFCQIYRDSKYYDGCVPSNSGREELPENWQASISMLIAADLVEVRECTGYAYQLTEAVRRFLDS